MALFREFLLIVAAGLLGSALGTGFGALVGVLSPEFVQAVIAPQPIVEPVRTGAAMGMIAGLLLGAATMVAGRFLGAVREWATARRPQPAPSSDHIARLG